MIVKTFYMKIIILIVQIFDIVYDNGYLIYFFYLLISISMILFLIKFNRKRIIKLKKEFDKKISDRTIEIQNKNSELNEQKEKLKLANKELERLSIIVNKTDNAIIITDKDGNFEWVNHAFKKIFGYGYDELVNNISKNIIGEHTPEFIKKRITECYEKKKSTEYELEILTKNKKYIWIHSTVTPILNKNGDIEGLIIIDSDISKIKNVEKEFITQHNEIQASLRYARTIQRAMLPENDELNNIFNNFVVYRPKDIVSGDFYWFTVAGYLTFIAVVDCTGHGVPGAFMSMIGNRLLNEIVNERGIYETDMILEELNKSIKKNLNQDKTDNRDGMDVVLCRLEAEDDETIISFTGAKRPLFIYEKETKELITVKGDRKTVGGKYFQKFNFTKKRTILEKGDMIYLTTDGYVDQNNEKIKKFGTRNLTKLLKEIAEEELTEQKLILENKLDEHQGSEIQRDDIAIVGIKI